MKKICIIFSFLFLLGCGITSSSTSQHMQNRGIRQEEVKERIRIGMTQQEVKEAWGDPDKIIKKQGKDFDEIWIYIPNWKFKNYLYFKDRILIRGEPDPESLV
ncbi:MAG: DUF1090 domain-containing protein [Candidatus Omnitrophica bacterium]|nr:DUF1090 domain-containing protein [Candidatus Omnitrophota bacterium]